MDIWKVFDIALGPCKRSIFTIDVRLLNSFICLGLVMVFIGCSKHQGKDGFSGSKQLDDTLESNSSSMELPNLDVNKAFLSGQFDYRAHDHFTKLSNEHAYDNIYLLEETYHAFMEMYRAAMKEGVRLTVVSGTRSFEEQKLIWNRKWNTMHGSDKLEKACSILEYSAMPMASRHHWGTDLDINSVEDDYFKSGKGRKEYEWLVKNASRFGFCQVYNKPSKAGRTGYQEEKWHWSYMPIASPLLQAYNNEVDYGDIKGFPGSDLACDLLIIDDYVNGISRKCE